MEGRPEPRDHAGRAGGRPGHGGTLDLVTVAEAAGAAAQPGAAGHGDDEDEPG